MDVIEAWITLSRIRVKARIGTDEHERTSFQDLLVSARLKTDIRSAVIYDSLEEAVDYMKVEKRIRDVASAREYQLIENLAYEICREILTIPKVLSIRLKITKFPQALEGKADGVSITLGPLESAKL